MDKQLATSNKMEIGQLESMSLDSPNGKTLYITPHSQEFDYKRILGKALQCINLADIVSEIRAGSQYVVQIPAKYQNAFNSGELSIMQNAKTGTMWPTLMRKLENGRKQVVTPLPITEQMSVNGNPLQSFTNGYHNLIIQQSIEHLSLTVEKTFETVKRIEHGQMDDRIGQLTAGKNGLLLALSMPEGPDRTLQIASSRQNLIVAQSQIGEVLKRKASEFVPIPKTKAFQIFHELKHAGYHDEKKHEVEEMQEYYELYFQSTKYIAASYVLCGNTESAEKAFQIGEQTLRGIDFSKVKSIRNIHRNAPKMFFDSPCEYLENERINCMEEAKEFDYIAIEVSGDLLLEEVNNG